MKRLLKKDSPMRHSYFRMKFFSGASHMDIANKQPKLLVSFGIFLSQI